MKKNKIFTQVIILIGIVVVLNLILNQVYLRLDFTADQRYTLSSATKDILEDLDDVITVTAYFSEDLPPQLLSNKQDFQDMLVEYEQRSGGDIVYEFVNPNENEEAEAEAQQKGIGPIMVNVTERDQVKQMRAYMGAVLQQGELTETIPVIQPGAGLEYMLTTAIKKLSVTDKPKVAFLQGHGEPSLAASAQVQEQLSVLYDVEPYTITDTAQIPGFYRAIAIIDPTDTIPASHLQKLDQYLQGGGGIFVTYSNLNGDLSSGYLQATPDIGISGWLTEKGVTLSDQFVVDANCGAVSVRQQSGPFVFNSQVEFPYFPIVNNFSDHAATEGLESVILPFVSAIRIDNPDSSVMVNPIAFSSENTGLVPEPTMVDINREWQESDFTAGPQILAVTMDGPLGGSGNSRMAVVANGRFAVNGEGQQQQQVNPDNVNLATNLIDWLSDDTGLIDLRTKGITSRPIEQVEDGTKTLIKYGNVFFPIILILGVAFVRKQNNSRKRQRWIQGDF